MVNNNRLLLLFVAGRLLTFLAAPVVGLYAYGDFDHFFHLAALPGWPFFNYWVEFPPIFPLLSATAYRLAGGQDHVYLYLLASVLTAADAGNFTLFARFADRFFSQGAALARKLTYVLVLIALPYCWWYFDPLAVFCMLLGINLVLQKKDLGAGLAFGLGFLVKFFPLIGLVAAWRVRKVTGILRIAGAAGFIALAVLGSLWLLTPDYTRVSLLSQTGKGSWETIWALIDGNFQTGAMAPPAVRADLASVSQNLALNPARIPPILTLAVFGTLGLWAISRLKIQTERQSIQVVCFTWGIFMLWTPGFSPQWILYLIPLLLLSLPEREGFLFTLVLCVLCLAEWPVLVSRGFFWTLLVTVPIRFLLFAGMTARVYQLLHKPEAEIKAGEPA
jgi:hypothetical protein